MGMSESLVWLFEFPYSYILVSIAGLEVVSKDTFNFQISSARLRSWKWEYLFITTDRLFPVTVTRSYGEFNTEFLVLSLQGLNLWFLLLKFHIDFFYGACILRTIILISFLFSALSITSSSFEIASPWKVIWFIGVTMSLLIICNLLAWKFYFSAVGYWFGCLSFAVDSWISTDLCLPLCKLWF
jgi:hypothetical protein